MYMLHMYVYVYVDKHEYTHILVYIYTYIYTYIGMYINIYICIYIYIDTRRREISISRVLGTGSWSLDLQCFGSTSCIMQNKT